MRVGASYWTALTIKRLASKFINLFRLIVTINLIQASDAGDSTFSDPAAKSPRDSTAISICYQSQNPSPECQT